MCQPTINNACGCGKQNINWASDTLTRKKLHLLLKDTCNQGQFSEPQINAILMTDPTMLNINFKTPESEKQPIPD